jgi:mannitol-1-phosphate 5-dehydrogenase
MAGGFVAPLLHEAGWELVLVSRNKAVIESINAGGGLWLRLTGYPPREQWISGVSAIALDDSRLPDLVAGADLLGTAVGPSSLRQVGRMLGPLLWRRLAETRAPINVITFENHRRAPELLTSGLMETCPAIAGAIGRRVGIGGAVVWRMIAHRHVTLDGVRLDASAEDECYVGAATLVSGAAPLDRSIPGIKLVRSFVDRMVEKLWLFNAGHAAAAYLGWHVGCATVDAAMAHRAIRATVRSVVAEAQQAFEAWLTRRPASMPIARRPLDSILDRYADAALGDQVVRVAREPRSKLAAGGRLIGPSVVCLAASGTCSDDFAGAAAALAYGERTDRQAFDLQREVELLGPAEVLATVSRLDPRDELTQLISASFRDRVHEGARYPLAWA